MRHKLGCGVLFLLLSAAHLFAQNSFWQESENIDRLLLKKDLAQAVKEAENLRDKYLARLFSTYLQANDRRSAEKLIAAGENFSMSVRIRQLAVNAAENEVSEEAVRFWKLKANLDRRDLSGFETLARRPEIKQSLKEFYLQMKANEPFSPVPDIALRRLK